MKPTLSVVGGFFLRTLIALVPALALWYWARESVVRPAAWLSERAMLYFFPGWVYEAELDGTILSLLTTIRITDASGRIGELSPEVDVLMYCYGLPMLAALILGAKARGWWWKIPFGALVLIPFQAWGVCMHWLVQVGVHFGPVSVTTTGFSSFQINAFALGYQLGYLILPTLVPVLLWLALERRFLTTVAVEAALEGSVNRYDGRR